MSGYVDFAGYEPSTFPPVTAESGYVYAYQVYSESCSNKSIGSFSLAVSPDSDVLSIGYDSTYSTGVEPSFSFFSPDQTNPDSADFLFMPKPTFSGLIAPSENSAILYFISNNAPTEGFGHVEGAGIGGNVASLPTPVPEPATIALMSLGLAVLIRKK